MNFSGRIGMTLPVPKPDHSHLAISRAADEMLAVITYGDVDIRIRFPAPEGVDGLSNAALVQKLAPQLHRVLSVALEDLGYTGNL